MSNSGWLYMRLLTKADKTKALKLLGSLDQIARDEMTNARATIPLIESNSRLSWEPSMEYMTDREHLEWKIRQVKTVVEYEISVYRKIIRL